MPESFGLMALRGMMRTRLANGEDYGKVRTTWWAKPDATA